MRLCAVILTSRTRAAIIGDAVRSVAPAVDALGLVYIPEGADRTLEIAEEASGGIYTWRQMVTPQQPAHEYRNLCLLAAASRGYDHALLIDTDERLHMNQMSVTGLRNILASAPGHINAFSVRHDSGTCSKPMFFRIPSPVVFQQGVHEDPKNLSALPMPHLRYSELEKTPEQMKIRNTYVLTGLSKQMAAEPENYRWPYYYGATLELMGEMMGAARYFRSAITFAPDEATEAWLCFRLANVLLHSEQHAAAKSWVEAGKTCAPWMAELHWLGGLIAAEQERWVEAANQSWDAVRLGFTEAGVKPHRQGFLYPEAMFDGPWEVLSTAWEALGNEDAAETARKHAKKAQVARINYCQKGIL